MSDERQEARDKQQNPGSRKGYGYRDLVVCQKGLELAKYIYGITQRFPSEEKFGLTSQMRRAAVSIPSNIAEGQARHTTKEFVQFISHAEGSLAELDTQLRLGLELGFCSNGETAHIVARMEEIRRMLNSLRRKLTAKEE